MNPDDASRVVEDPSQRDVVVYTREGRRVVVDPKAIASHGPVQGGFNPAIVASPTMHGFPSGSGF